MGTGMVTVMGMDTGSEASYRLIHSFIYSALSIVDGNLENAQRRRYREAIFLDIWDLIKEKGEKRGKIRRGNPRWAW